ncbi:MAG: LacI family transcriptional regulator [Spirochaetae bacterium HGW-Spirochaetae-4]|jgi:LacI family transcriptional regulator|nr:MAG: LacI family transcriptional regulator [Spirochaetae bacterium HGW-Spirochaetae-8]PKL22072.1 MAG: LacI family transcriptional regulator [Spirochaetae bacterium HGW-Spirochaetae-4]
MESEIVEKNESNGKREKSTIVDVARVAGTSVATVSRALSGGNYPVSMATRKKIQLAVETVGYTPNLLGKMLKTKFNPTIGIVIPSYQNPFYIQLIHGISQKAALLGYTISTFSSQRNVLFERNIIKQLLQKRIMGLMIASVDDSPNTLTQYISNGGKVCVFESNFKDLNTFIVAKTDMIESGRTAMKHLISMGHENIAIITTPLSKQSRSSTIKGCRLAMAEHNHEFTDEDIIIAPYEYEFEDGLYEFEVGQDLVKILLERKKKYTAILAVNDLIACGIINELKKMNIRVPEDISVIGLDDIPLSSMISPALTTVHMPSYNLGQKACQLMVDAMVNQEETYGVALSIRPELVIRDSVKRLE